MSQLVNFSQVLYKLVLSAEAKCAFAKAFRLCAVVERKVILLVSPLMVEISITRPFEPLSAFWIHTSIQYSVLRIEGRVSG